MDTGRPTIAITVFFPIKSEGLGISVLSIRERSECELYESQNMTDLIDAETSEKILRETPLAAVISRSVSAFHYHQKTSFVVSFLISYSTVPNK